MEALKNGGDHLEENRKVMYVVSSLVKIFPPKSESEYAALKESIRGLGLLEPILLWRKTVVDGFHRLRACLELGVQPEFDVLPAEADPLEIVANRVGNQRHLNETARAATGVMAMGKPMAGRPKRSEKNAQICAVFGPGGGRPRPLGSAREPSPPWPVSWARKVAPSPPSAVPSVRG